MKPLLALAACALAGCSLIDASQPAHYLCLRDAGSLEQQCPGGWVCGAAGFCIDPNVPSTYACATDQDCVGGWHCGLDNLCLDPDAPRPFRCDSDHDCAGGWHCGPANFCYDRSAATDVPCRPAVPDDCAPTWRCGLNGTCHDTDAGAAYACTTDLDCERGWRCGPNGACLDASGDALRSNQGLPVPTLELINPRVPGGLPDQVSSSKRAGLVCDGGVTTRTSSWSHGSLLSRLYRYRTALDGKPTNCTPGAPRVQAELFQTQLSFSGARQLIDDGDLVWAVTTDGGLTVISFDTATLAFTERPLPVPLDVTTVVPFSSPDRSPIAIGVDRLAVGSSDGGWDLTPPLPSDAGLPLSVSSYISLFGPMLSVVLPEGAAQIVITDGGTFAGLATADWVLLPSPDQPFTCSDGGSPLDWFHYNDLPYPGPADYVLYCSSPDGGVIVERDLIVGSTLETHVPVPPSGYGPLRWPVRRSRPSNIGNLALADDVGGLRVDYLSAETLTTVPKAAMGFVDAPLVSVDALPGGNGAGYGYDVSPADSYEWCDAGFVTRTRDPLTSFTFAGDPVLLTGVDGRPDWGLFSHDPDPLVAVATHGTGLAWPTAAPDYLAAFPYPLAQPLRAAAPPSTADGGTVLWVSSLDTLYFAQVPASPAPGAGLAPQLEVALVPQLRANIGSLLALPPEPGAAFSLGYVIARGRVYRVSADNPIVWRALEASLAPTEAIALWKDGRRARVGFGDGAVFALTSGILVALPLAPATVAVDFAGVCGHTFMLTRDGLFQSVVSVGATVGTWRPVALAATGLLAQPMAKLQTDDRGLLIYHERGVVERLQGLTCLPPE